MTTTTTTTTTTIKQARIKKLLRIRAGLYAPMIAAMNTSEFPPLVKRLNRINELLTHLGYLPYAVL